MPPKLDLSDQRKIQILEAAMRVFARHGFDKTRMDDIVAEAGMSKGALYWYFDSKEQIILEVLSQIIIRELDALTQIRNKNSSPRTSLFELTELIIQDLDELQAYMPILYEFYALGLRSPRIRDLVAQVLDRYTQVLAPIIAQGVTMGEFKQLDPRQVALAIGAMVEGTILLKAYNPNLINLHEQIRSGMAILMQGLEA